MQTNGLGRGCRIVSVLLALSLPSTAQRVLSVLIARPATRPIEDCDYGLVRLRAHSDGSVAINGERLAPNTLGAMLNKIYVKRAERVIFFEADPDVDFGRVVSLIEALKGVPALYVAMVTDTTRSARCFSISPAGNKR